MCFSFPFHSHSRKAIPIHIFVPELQIQSHSRAIPMWQVGKVRSWCRALVDSFVSQWPALDIGHSGSHVRNLSYASVGIHNSTLISIHKLTFYKLNTRIKLHAIGCGRIQQCNQVKQIMLKIKHTMILAIKLYVKRTIDILKIQLLYN